MKFEEAFNNIGQGKVISLENKSNIIIGCPLSMISIKPNITHAGIIVINTETDSEALYHVASEIKEFTKEEFESDKWVVKSIKDCKYHERFEKLINNNRDNIYKIIEDIQSLIYNYRNCNLENIDMESKLYALSICHQLLEATTAMRRVLMWHNEPYSYDEIVPYKNDEETSNNE